MRTVPGTPFHSAARALIAVLLFAGAAASGLVPQQRARAQPAVGEPNVLIIVTDDQRAGTTRDVMPATTDLFANGGTTFRKGYATTPLCCPSRASIFSGRYAHNHGAKNNRQAAAFDEDSTIQRYLKERGYRTAIFGKYLLGRRIDANPAHFDTWSTFLRSPHAYQDGYWNVDGTVQYVPGYSTTYIGDRAVEFITQQETLDVQPWMMVLSTAAPHAPFTPEDQYRGAPVPGWKANPAVREGDLRDKPPIHRLGSARARKAERVRDAQLRTLMSVDDMVERVFETLELTGEDDTIAFYLSDNGYLWGEHHLMAKKYPYLPAVRIPFMMRWPGHVDGGATDDRLVATIDVVPTIMDALDITPDPEYPIDGRSLLGDHDRKRLLLEFWQERNLWTWSSNITRRYHYTEYYDESGYLLFQEYYDLRDDPWELRNLYGDRDPFNDPNRGPLAERLARDRVCVGPTCP